MGPRFSISSNFLSEVKLLLAKWMVPLYVCCFYSSTSASWAIRYTEKPRNIPGSFVFTAVNLEIFLKNVWYVKV